jgi:hypothetical protein
MGITAGVARRARYAGWLLGGAVLATSAGAAAGFVALGAVARVHVAWLGVADTTIGGWSFTAAYALLGLLAGGAFGLAFGLARALGQVEADMQPALQAESARAAAEGGGRAPRLETAELRRRFERFADEAIARSVGAVRLPGAGVVARLVRARLRRCLVDDFLAACEREGVTSVGPAEIGRWLAAQGPGYLLAPVYAQLRVWRIVAVTVVVLAVVAPALLTLGP